MMRLRSGRIVREVVVNDGVGRWAYYINFNSSGLPEVGLEDEFKMDRLAGYHVKFNDRDFVTVKGPTTDLSAEELLDLKELLYTASV